MFQECILTRPSSLKIQGPSVRTCGRPGYNPNYSARYCFNSDLFARLTTHGRIKKTHETLFPTQ